MEYLYKIKLDCDCVWSFIKLFFNVKTILKLKLKIRSLKIKLKLFVNFQICFTL